MKPENIIHNKVKMLTCTLGPALFMGALLNTGCSSATKESKPNIIVFLVDDMGWQDTSVPFWKQKTPLNEKFSTPAMERLASQGMKFTQAYACSVCTPSRVSLMSGMNAARHRVTNWTLDRNVSTDKQDDILQFPDWNLNGAQPADSIENSVCITALPQLLKDNGYFTIHCGKAHFGTTGTPAANPSVLGFDINIAGHAAGAPATYQGLKNFGNDENGLPLNKWAVPGLQKYHGQDIHLSEALTIEAKHALDSALAVHKPFFLYMAHYAVHTPIEADSRFYRKYLDRGYPEVEARYASMIEGMDKSLGDLMDYLEEKGIEENTIVLFMSDNGGLSAHTRAGELHTHNKPLNSGKGSAYEGGIREPMIVKWPGVVKGGTRNDDPVIIEDFFPTILEMAGVSEWTSKQVVDGVSFVQALKQEGNITGRDLFWHYPNKWGAEGPGIGTTSSIRSGDWKLIYWYKDQHMELFNIKNDLGEQDNQAKQHPEIVKDLAKKLGNYLRKVDAQRPVLKESGKVVPWPDEAL
ncbi:MAG: sulfatase [Mangrovibacterium sp.]